MKKLKLVSLLALPLLLAAVSAEAGGKCFSGGHGAGKIFFLLVSLAVGYWVLTLSVKQKKPLNIVGRVVGIIILLVAVCGLVCSAMFGYCRIKSGKGAKCAISGPHKGCPFSGHKKDYKSDSFKK